MIKLGITGNIGSGKTTVCALFEALGVPVIYADRVSRQLLEDDPTVMEAVISLLGKESYRDGIPDRAFIAAQVFGSKTKLSGLNGIIHPRVHGSIQRWFAELPADTPYAIEEAALLIESGGFRLLDELILVTAPEELRIQRVMKRDLVAREQVEARINHQMKESEKRRYCDYIIKNDGEHLLLPQVLSIHQELLAQIL